jgi:hypothetical protein
LHVAAANNDVDTLSMLIHSFPRAVLEDANEVIHICLCFSISSSRCLSHAYSHQANSSNMTERDNPLLNPFLTDVLKYILEESRLLRCPMTALLLWHRGIYTHSHLN